MWDDVYGKSPAYARIARQPRHSRAALSGVSRVSRLLLLVVIAAAVFWLLQSYRRRLPEANNAPEASAKTEDMVRCAQCGVHLPKSESILTQGRYYCCEEHRRAGEARPE